MERTSVSFTILLLALSPAQAAHPSQKLETEGRARVQVGEFVGSTPDARGLVFARQVMTPPLAPAGFATRSPRAQSRVVFMNRDGAMLWPGDNDAGASKSSIVSEPTMITPWQIDDEMWDETMACMTDLFSRFDVRITDVDPGESVQHIQAVFGGHPGDVGLADNVAGVSPFATDCSVIEDSVVFTFTDVLPDNAQLMCEIMAQEIAHSYGLDHQLLAEDPMSYLDYEDNRTFQDADAVCGEYEARPCGINGNVCWNTQNSVELLSERLGPKGQRDDSDDPGEADLGGDDGRGSDNSMLGGCSTGAGDSSLPALAGLAALALLKRRGRART